MKTRDHKPQLKINHNETEKKEVIEIIDLVKKGKQPIIVDSQKSLADFQKFALNYSPKRKPNLGVAMLPETPDSILNAITILKTSQPEEFEKYLILIFVKLYSAHLECCHQSYEMRRESAYGLDRTKDPLIYEFNLLSKKYPNTDEWIEIFSSGDSHSYVMSNKHLLDFPPIKKHIKIIEKVFKNIDEGVYWK
ncbi:hypothetical protein [uncultured Kordia sp.]|uniref:hypothetical protein n=1 Tax=uncultured Kordia sp. TaxID=507699 RepID=UPI00261AC835|nr:hypothetical protein [uncultured Kordia sp.]